MSTTETTTVEVEGKKYRVFTEHSGRRGTYNQWSHVWVRLEEAILQDPNGENMYWSERYINGDVWYMLDKERFWSHYSQIQKVCEEIVSLKEVIRERSFVKEPEPVGSYAPVAYSPPSDPTYGGLLGKSTLVRRPVRRVNTED